MNKINKHPSMNELSEILLPGFKPVMEIIEERPESISKVYCQKDLRAREQLVKLCQSNDIKLELCEPSVLDVLVKSRDHKVAHQGLIAKLKLKNLMSDSELLHMAPDAPLPLVIALDQIQDPGNLGTLCRTAFALGIAGMLVPVHASANPGPAAFKASAGTLAELPLALVTNLGRTLDLAEELGFTIYGTGLDMPASENALSCNWQFPAVLVLGNEQKGIRPGVAKRCAINVTIPFKRPFDSLNIAQAGAILLALVSRAQMANSHMSSLTAK